MTRARPAEKINLPAEDTVASAESAYAAQRVE